jgi:hypothetical protein
MRERRALLTSVRRAMTRWAFLAELVLAMISRVEMSGGDRLATKSRRV